MFLYQIANLPSYQQGDRIQYLIRRNGKVFLKVPRERMSIEMQRITRMGGKIISIEPLDTVELNSEHSSSSVATTKQDREIAATPPSVDTEDREIAATPSSVDTEDREIAATPPSVETATEDREIAAPPSVETATEDREIAAPPSVETATEDREIATPSAVETVAEDKDNVNIASSSVETVSEDKDTANIPVSARDIAKKDDRVEEEKVEPKLILAWWLEATIEGQSRIYYFGPFDSVEDALSSQSEYFKKLFNEGARGISIQVRYCKPQKLIVDE